MNGPDIIAGAFLLAGSARFGIAHSTLVTMADGGGTIELLWVTQMHRLYGG
jgi:hypothetical protein